jgi:tRNA A37 threonylcarbamoyladenosine dehydratase
MNTPHSPLDDDHERRFGGIDRLYGEGVRMALHRSRVAVVGVGGVGSWAVEALARSGIGHITLIDLDHVAVSNVNRQIQALDSTLGKAKVLALEARIRDINPDCKVIAIDDFLTEENVGELIPAGAFDAVIDSCDNARAKTALIAHARDNNIPLVVCGAAGGKSNPLNLRQSDLGKTNHDALLLNVRKRLRREFGILPRRTDKKSKHGKYGVTSLFLDESPKKNAACSANKLSCSGYGSVVTVTASIGLAAAAWCLDQIVAKHAGEG